MTSAATPVNGRPDLYSAPSIRRMLMVRRSMEASVSGTRAQRSGRRLSRLAALAAAMLVAAACDSTPTQPPAGTQGPVASQPSSSVGAGPTDGATVGEPASEDKIAAAERTGAIDHDTALLYDVYAAFDPTSLPSEYQSTNPAAPEGTAALEDLGERMSELPADMQAKLGPYFLRPSDPESFWNKRMATTAAARGTVQLAAFSEVEYSWLDAKSTNVRIWYANPLDTGEEELAQRLADEIDSSGMWAKEKTAMLGHEPCSDEELFRNGGDKRLDVYLTYPSVDLDWRGRSASLHVKTDDKDIIADGVTIHAGAVTGCPEAAFILLNGTMDFDHLRDTMAHELFHAFQFSFKLPPAADRHWWMEATATWAEDLVYPKLNMEQPYLNGYWSQRLGADPEGPIDDDAGTAEYATYLLPFYLVQKSGDPSGTLVGRTWAASEAATPLQVVAALPGWRDSFAEFALWNWNRDREAHYQDAGAQIPTGTLSQNTRCVDSQARGSGTGTGARDCLVSTKTISTTIQLASTSVQYFEATPDEPTVQKLQFELPAVFDEPGFAVHAILVGGGGTRVEDWTGSELKSYCVQRDDVHKVILVVSNSSIAKDAEGAPATAGATIAVTGLEGGCSSGHYSIDVQNLNGAHVPGPGHHEGDGDIQCALLHDGTFTAGGVYFPSDAVDPGKDVGSFHIVSTPGHEWLEMTLMDHTSDSPFDWSVQQGFYDPTFTFRIDDQPGNVTVTATGESKYEQIKIVARCSQVDRASV